LYVNVCAFPIGKPDTLTDFVVEVAVTPHGLAKTVYDVASVTAGHKNANRPLSNDTVEPSWSAETGVAGWEDVHSQCA
jgi:hypothetical protein